MAQGIFTEKAVQPTEGEIRRGLGDAAALWEELTSFVRQNYRVKEDLKFYGKNFGWALRFRKAGKALLSLYPLCDALKAQVVLNEKAVKQALKLPLGVRLNKIIRNAHPYTDGRWLFIAVKTMRDVDRIKKLIRVKAGR